MPELLSNKTKPTSSGATSNFRFSSLSEPGNSTKPNEDVVVCLPEDNLYGIYDGATSLSNFADEHGNTGGFLAAKIAGAVTEKSSASNPKQLLLAINNAIAAAMSEQSIDLHDKTQLWSTTAAIIKLGEERMDWAQISDSIILVVFADGTYQTFGEKRNHDQGLLRLLRKLQHNPRPDAKDIIKQYVYDLRNRSNVDYGFLNGEAEAEKFINSESIELGNVDHILIFSDGLIPLVEDAELDPEYSELIKIYKRKGVVGIRDWIRSLEDADPDCTKYIRYKQHDDISIIGLDHS